MLWYLNYGIVTLRIFVNLFAFLKYSKFQFSDVVERFSIENCLDEKFYCLLKVNQYSCDLSVIYYLFKRTLMFLMMEFMKMVYIFVTIFSVGYHKIQWCLCNH